MDFWESVAMEAYEAYSRVTGNKNYRGEEMPKFLDLPQTIQNAWSAAAKRSVDYCVNINLNGLDWGEEYRTPNNGVNTDTTRAAKI